MLLLILFCLLSLLWLVVFLFCFSCCSCFVLWVLLFAFCFHLFCFACCCCCLFVLADLFSSCSGLYFDSVDEISRLYFDKSNTKWINPSDCVDMDCDARRQLLIRDLDGSFTGAVGSAILSMAEYQWDGDKRFGVGKPRYQHPDSPH